MTKTRENTRTTTSDVKVGEGTRGPELETDICDVTIVGWEINLDRNSDLEMDSVCRTYND